MEYKLDSEEYVQYLIDEQNKWQASCAQLGKDLKTTINNLLSINTTESLNQLITLLASSDIQSIFDTDSEITYACFIIAIYREELNLEAADIHKLPEGIYSTADLFKAFRRIKFLLLNIEFDTDASNALNILSNEIESKMLSITAVTYVVQASCINKKAVFEKLITKLSEDDARLYADRLRNNLNIINPNDISFEDSDLSALQNEHFDLSDSNENNSFCFIFCSNDEQYETECLRYINSLNVPDGYTVDALTIKDAPSMTSGYQEGMLASNAKYKIYLHHDVFITNKNMLFDILDIFKDKNIGMIGMVGSIKLPKTAIMWHGPRFGRLYCNNVLQAVDCPFDYPIPAHSDSGKNVTSVEAIDGLMMITQYDIPWRTDLFTGWDFYDISQSFEFRKAGYDVVVPNMQKPWCYHNNGLSNLTNYYKYREIFMNEYL